MNRSNPIAEYIKTQNIDFDNTLDIESLLKNVKCDDNIYLNDTQNDIHRTLSSIMSIDEDSIIKLQSKLVKYRLVDEIYLLHKGKHVRWINKDDPSYKLNIGGVVTDIRFLNNGTHFFIFNRYMKRNIQIQFDKTFLFQKLSFDEEIIQYLKRTI